MRRDWVVGVVGRWKWVARYDDVFVPAAAAFCCDDFGIVRYSDFVDNADEGASIAVLIAAMGLGLEEGVFVGEVIVVVVVGDLEIGCVGASEVCPCKAGFYVRDAGKVEGQSELWNEDVELREGLNAARTEEGLGGEV